MRQVGVRGCEKGGPAGDCWRMAWDRLGWNVAARNVGLARCAFVLLWLLTLPTRPAWGEDVLTAIRQLLGNPEVVRGEFEQKKSIETLGKPLISRGAFVFARGRGVVWRTQTPFAQTFRLTQTGITQEQGGEILFTLPADREPAIRAMGAVLLPLFSADFARLNRFFRIAGELRGKSWSVVLEPIPAALVQAFRQIRLEGGNVIHRAEFLDANGDRTDIRFSRVQTADLLTTEEQRLLQ